MNDLESIECLHFSLEGIGADSPIQSDSEAGRVFWREDSHTLSRRGDGIGPPRFAGATLT